MSAPPHEKNTAEMAVFVWWNRPVTAHCHEKYYMDRVAKISVVPVIARKIIEGYQTPPEDVLSVSNIRFQ
jgi:hypothetical protein